MEIRTEDIIAGLENIIPNDIASGQVTEKSIRRKLDAIQLIKAQAREIRELQLTICRLKEENQKQYEESQK